MDFCNLWPLNTPPPSPLFYSSMDFCNLCTRVFDRSDRRTMKFDDFIQCCVMLRSLTEGFKKLDTDRNGVVRINYEQVCMCVHVRAVET